MKYPYRRNNILEKQLHMFYLCFGRHLEFNTPLTYMYKGCREGLVPDRLRDRLSVGCWPTGCRQYRANIPMGYRQVVDSLLQQKICFRNS